MSTSYEMPQAAWPLSAALTRSVLAFLDPRFWSVAARVCRGWHAAPMLDSAYRDAFLDEFDPVEAEDLALYEGAILLCSALFK